MLVLVLRGVPPRGRGSAGGRGNVLGVRSAMVWVRVRVRVARVSVRVSVGVRARVKCVNLVLVLM